MPETRSSAPKPPNLRDAKKDSDERCGTCKMFDKGVCWGFGNYRVEPDETCDRWYPDSNEKTERPPLSETRGREAMYDMRVVSEPRTYDRESPHSFFKDQAFAMHDPGARARLDKHLREVQHEIEHGTAEGRRALREYEQHYRDSDRKRTTAQIEAEVRAGNSTTINGFTTPQWIISEYALFRGTQRTFADQCKRMPMPGVGLQVNVPRFTSQVSAGVLSEGSSVATIEQDPAGIDNSENVPTIVGQIVTSQQTIDRTRNMPDGPTFDLVLYDQIRDAYDQALNNYVIFRTTSVGATVTGASSFASTNGLATLYADIASAREKLTDTNGVRLQPTHLFTTPDLYSYMSHQLDAQNRPIIVPSLAPGVPPGPVGEEHNTIARAWIQFTGSVVPGLLFWFIDATIPPVGSITPIIVARMDKVLLFESDPVVRAFPQTLGPSLQIVAQYYAYAACVPRFPGAVATVLGTAYTTSLV